MACLRYSLRSRDIPCALSITGGRARSHRGRPYGWRRSRSTNTSVEGQKRATSLSVTTRWRSACRHFSFDVHTLHLRCAIAKIISVRGSTIASRSMPRFSTSAKNSACPEGACASDLLSFVIAHDLPNRVGTTPAGRLVPKASINLRDCRRFDLGKGGAYLKIAEHVTGTYNHCSDSVGRSSHETLSTGLCT